MNQRQEEICNIIKNKDISTQEELCKELKERGYTVTQATVSRDIQYLHLFKENTPNGKRYVTKLPKKATHFLNDMVKDIDFAQNIVVLKCFTGMAQAVCADLDAMNLDEIMGTIAGDDTIFVLLKTIESAERLSAQLRKSFLK